MTEKICRSHPFLMKLSNQFVKTNQAHQSPALRSLPGNEGDRMMPCLPFNCQIAS